jgi:hypothetical protein
MRSRRKIEPQVPPLPGEASTLTSPGGTPFEGILVVENGKGPQQNRRDAHVTRRSSDKETTQRTDYHHVKGRFRNPFDFGGSDEVPSALTSESKRTSVKSQVKAQRNPCI